MTDVPPARQCTLPSCEREAVEAKRSGKLCAHHREQLGEEDDAECVRTSEGKGTEETHEKLPDSNSQNSNTQDGSGSGGTSSGSEGVSNRDKVLNQRDCHRAAGEDIDRGGWNSLFPADPDRRTYPRPQYDLEYWMGAGGTGGKQPFAIWGDRDAPAECNKDGHTTAAECDCDARWKWGYRGHYRDGADAELALADPEIETLTYILHDDEPTMLVDGDKVVDPASGAVHPQYLELLARFGLTYADISLSETGTHAIYQGTLPEGVKQATWELGDEPWGANDEPPSIEIYDHGRVCVMTGKHVPGTPTGAREIDADALEAILDKHDQLPTATPTATPTDDMPTARETYDLEGYDPVATSASETTNDARDIFAALERLDGRDVAERTIVHAWNDDASTSDGKRAFVPTWGPSANGTANIVDDRIWQDTGGGGYGGPVVMALIDEGEMSHRNASPRDATGELWWKGVEHLRELGYDIPEYESGEAEREPVSALPLGRLEALNPADARRYAKKRDIEWPTTAEARDRLRDRILEAIRHGEEVVVDAPTALGKSHTVATEPWLNHPDVTDEQPVIHFHETREARDQAAAASRRASSVIADTLKGRIERCPVAAGAHDPADEDDEDAPDVVVTIQGMPASDWVDAVCDGRGVPFSVAHARLAEYHDQGHDHLPCCPEGTECPASTQWDEVPRDGGGLSTADVVHATHQFAHVPSLVRRANVVFDERPDFKIDMSTDRVQRAIAAYLKEIDAPVTTWEAFVQLALHDGEHGDTVAERDATADVIQRDPDREWYFKTADAHTLAPALARAVWYALSDEADANGRQSTTVMHEPPRLEAGARDEEGWNRAWVSVVLDEDNRIQHVRNAPDLSLARSVIGLDAHPTLPLWQRNTTPDMSRAEILAPQERRLWRRFERGLQVVQVGEATRPYASGEYFDEGGTRAVLEQLREHYGDDFQTAITASAVEGRTKRLMDDVGIDGTETMHYGEEKSRNDFGGERVGLVNGSIDPGDGYVVNLLAECGLDARPETTTTADGEQRRAHGREFIGPDADTAAALLESVRENHVAQAAGRYARDADAPDGQAVVFVRTDASPPGFVDLQAPGVEWLATDTQQEILKALRDREHATTAELADAVDVTKEHVRNTLRRLADAGRVKYRENAGKHGAHLYDLLAGSADVSGVVRLDAETTNDAVWGPNTWALAVSAPRSALTGSGTSQTSPSPARDSSQAGLGAFSGGDPPPDGSA